jgi:site-specific DNA recombinase
MITAVYGRTSHETDDAYSVSSQIDATLSYAKSTGLTVPTEYVFREDFTGRVLDRPELNKIRALIREKKIQALVVYATDRLARRTGVGEILLDEMIDHDVQLHIVAWGSYVRDIPEDRLRFNFETTFSSFERDKFVERNRRGRRKKASLGFVIGNNYPTYGYWLNESKSNFVHTEHAKYAQMVLKLYVDGWTNADIHRHMQEIGAPTPGEVEYEWRMKYYDARLREGFITKEEYDKKKAYCIKRKGRAEWNHSMVYPILRKHRFYAGKFTFSVFGEKFTVDIPPLITEEESNEIARRLAEARNKTQRKKTPIHDFLMGRRLRCAICGNVYVINYNAEGRCYYKCWGKAPKAYKVCQTKAIKRDTIDNKAKEFLRELLLNPRRLFTWWEEQHKAELSQVQDREGQIAAIERRIEQTQAKYHRTLDRLTDALDADEAAYYTQQRDSLKALIGEFKEELETLQEKQLFGKVSEQIVRDFMTMGEDYRYALEHSQDFTFWRGLVDDLDIMGLIGEHEGRRYIEFLVFGKVRKRFYLNTEPSAEGGEQSRIDFSCSSMPCRLSIRWRAGRPRRRMTSGSASNCRRRSATRGRSKPRSPPRSCSSNAWLHSASALARSSCNCRPAIARSRSTTSNAGWRPGRVNMRWLWRCVTWNGSTGRTKRRSWPCWSVTAPGGC